MTEFVAKKLGEVFAFSSLGLEIMERGRPVLSDVFGSDYLDNIAKDLNSHISEIQIISKENEFEGIVNAKSMKTKDKLTRIMELYVGDEWNNPTEILEWLGFFEGAAIVHWQLVLGAGEGLRNNRIEDLATNATEFHENLFSKIGDLLRGIGSKKSTG